MANQSGAARSRSLTVTIPINLKINAENYSSQLEPRSQPDGKWIVGQGMATAFNPVHRFPASARVRTFWTEQRPFRLRRTRWELGPQPSRFSTRQNDWAC
jgi:hypothetical protein